MSMQLQYHTHFFYNYKLFQTQTINNFLTLRNSSDFKQFPLENIDGEF